MRTSIAAAATWFEAPCLMAEYRANGALMKRFVTAVFKHETNTFSPIPTPLESFGRYAGERGPVYGEDALEAYRSTGTPVGAFIDLAAEAGAELVFPVAANANPVARPPTACSTIAPRRSARRSDPGATRRFWICTAAWRRKATMIPKANSCAG